MIRYDHYTDKFVKVSDRECPWCKAVCASTDKYCHECGWYIAGASQTDSEVTRNSLRTDCTGCKFVGWYDTEFPCANCVRKNKDYYTSEQTERSDK